MMLAWTKEDGVKARLNMATAELEDRVWRRIIGATSIATSAEDDRRLHNGIMSDIRLCLSEAARDIADPDGEANHG